jgi:hypothetical protein
VRVILRVWSNNPDYNAGCDYAVAEISYERRPIEFLNREESRVSLRSSSAALNCFERSTRRDFLLLGVVKRP